MSLRVLVADNDDSFVHTLCDYLAQLGAEVLVHRSRDLDTNDLDALLVDVDAVLISPGPGAPGDAGASIDLVHAAAARRTPLLGVCLGHQAIAEAYGGEVDTAAELMHGKTSLVRHESDGIFDGLPSPLTATRYHSLAVRDENLSPDLVVTARTEGGVIMALAHRTLPQWGVQFHPESVLTEGGHRLLANWLDTAGMSGAIAAAEGRHPLVGPE
ncbi:aminodeoxychorismate/anthranilate synthase component II [Microbacterium sp. HA-8]|uniref:anthranilate synthase component II n=1 Tax=Microbacterium sp. HA-8 TaxID=3234200 RepID=UPI0038F60104